MKPISEKRQNLLWNIGLEMEDLLHKNKVTEMEGIMIISMILSSQFPREAKPKILNTLSRALDFLHDDKEFNKTKN